MRNKHRHGKILVYLLISICFLASCTEVKPPIDNSLPVSLIDDDIFGNRPDIISPDDIFTLSEQQKKDFLVYFNSSVLQDVPLHERVYNYLQRIVSGFNYQGETYTAEEALRLSGGNCLSLAIITTALARLARVEIGYQLVDDIPVFEQKERVIFKGVHVRSILYYTFPEPDKMDFYLGRPYIKIDYFPSGNERFIKYISEPDYIAMFYRNKAAEAIARGDFKAAYWLVTTSLQLQPDSSQAINMMAVIYSHANNEKRSEEIYKFGIEHSDEKISLLKNYRILLKRQGRIDDAELVSIKLAQLDDPSPFVWMHQARDAYNEGKYSIAVKYYRKATEIAPYLHEGHFGMAKSYYQLGYIHEAEREMREAIKQSFRESTKSLYQAKLIALSRMQ